MHCTVRPISSVPEEVRNGEVQRILPSSLQLFGFIHQLFQKLRKCRLYGRIILMIEDDERYDDFVDEIQ